MLPRLFLSLALVALCQPARADSPLRFLPSSTRVVLTINVPTLGDSEKKLGQELVRQLYTVQLAPELKLKSLPITDLKQVIIAQPHAGTLAAVIIVRGKIDAKLMEKQLRQAATASKGALSIVKMGKPAVPVFRRNLDEKQLMGLFPMLDTVPAAVRKLIAPQEAYVAALDEETMFISLNGRISMERALRARPAKTAPRTSDELTKLLKAQNDKDIATAIITEDCLNPALGLVVPKETSDTFEKFSSIVVRVQGGKTITVTLKITGKSKDNATALEKTATTTIDNILEQLPKSVKDDGQRKALQGLFKSFKVSRKDSVVTITGKMSEDDARKLLPRLEKK